MKYYKKCECCGNKVVAHTYKMNKGLADAFCKLYTEYIVKKRKNMSGGDVWIERDEIDLTNSQYTAFRLLRLRGLARRSDKGWKPTKLGEDWFFDREAVDDRIAIMGNERLRRNHEAWETSKSSPKVVALSSVLERAEFYSYKQRADYQGEMPNSADEGTGLFTPDDL